MLSSKTASFVVVGLSETPAYFWLGVALTDVLGMVAHVDEDTRHIKLLVRDNSAFDTQYAAMSAAGIHVKKVRS